MDEELELSDEVRELFLAGKLDALLEHVAQLTRDSLMDEKRQKINEWRRGYLERNPDKAAEGLQRAKERKRSLEYRERARSYREKWISERKSDPEWVEGERARAREYWRKRREDPGYIQARKDYNREYQRNRRARKKAEKEAQENND